MNREEKGEQIVSQLKIVSQLTNLGMLIAFSLKLEAKLLVRGQQSSVRITHQT
jgi:hypothetical protein